MRKTFTTLPVWSPQHSCPWSYTVSVIVNSIGSILDIGLNIHCMCFVTAHYRVSCDGIGHTRHVAETGYLENSLDPRPSTPDPRPSTFIYLFIFYMSNYKIREPISGQCWLTVCDAGLTLAERLVHVWGSGTIPIYFRQGYILTNLINMSVKLFSTVSIVFFPVDFKSVRYHSRFCIFN